MTVTAEQAKAMLDAATPGPWWEDAYGLYGAGKVAVIMGPHPPSDADAALIAAAPDLAATVVELWERLATVEAERDAAQRGVELWSCNAYNDMSALVDMTARRDALMSEIGLLTNEYGAAVDQRDALQAAIDKVLALHSPFEDDFGDLYCDECMHMLEIESVSSVPYPCPTVAILRGEG